MTPEDFKIWRGRLALTQVGAAAELELTPRAIKHYEAGTRRITPQIEMLTRDVERRLLKGRGSRAKFAGMHDYYDPRDIFATPQAFFDRLDAEFGFTLDVCALPENAKCPVFFTPEMNGLAHAWHGVAWMNPPFFQGRIGTWLAKAFGEVESGRCTVVAFVHSVFDTAWWHDYVLRASEIRFIRGRVAECGRAAVIVFRPGDQSAKVTTMRAKD
jgi:phage N-6-adenine-methyltransferase